MLHMKRDLEDLKHDLSHVYWLGGASKGGKSTAAESIQHEFGYFVYDHDEKWLGGSHARLADPDRHPTMFRYRDLYEEKLTVEKYFAYGPYDELVEDQFDFFAEQFDMVVDDLLKLPRSQPILADGIGLLPEQVSQVAEPHRAIYLVSTEAFAQSVHDSKDWGDRESWLVRMHFEYGERLKERTIAQAKDLGLRVVETGGRLSIKETIDLVKAHFGFSS